MYRAGDPLGRWLSALANAEVLVDLEPAEIGGVFQTAERIVAKLDAALLVPLDSLERSSTTASTHQRMKSARDTLARKLADDAGRALPDNDLRFMRGVDPTRTHLYDLWIAVADARAKARRTARGSQLIAIENALAPAGGSIAMMRSLLEHPKLREPGRAGIDAWSRLEMNVLVVAEAHRLARERLEAARSEPAAHDATTRRYLEPLFLVVADEIEDAGLLLERYETLRRER